MCIYCQQLRLTLNLLVSGWSAEFKCKEATHVSFCKCYYWGEHRILPEKWMGALAPVSRAAELSQCWLCSVLFMQVWNSLPKQKELQHCKTSGKSVAFDKVSTKTQLYRCCYVFLSDMFSPHRPFIRMKGAPQRPRTAGRAQSEWQFVLQRLTLMKHRINRKIKRVQKSVTSFEFTWAA